MVTLPSRLHGGEGGPGAGVHAAGKASPEPDSNALFRNMNQVAEGIVIRGVDSGARTTLATVQP